MMIAHDSQSRLILLSPRPYALNRRILLILSLVLLARARGE